MALYDAFAHVYTTGPYGAFSEAVSRLLPALLDEFGCRPESVLDIACGDARFAAVMGARGCRVVGLDASHRMLVYGRERVREMGLSGRVALVQGDMRSLPFTPAFDLVTSWYDSLNYLLEERDLRQCFRAVGTVLAPGGLFIFDMNTIYALAVDWQRRPCYVNQARDDLFEVHRVAYDEEQKIGSIDVTAFSRMDEGADESESESERGRWRRVDVVHRERGYTLKEVRAALSEGGLEVLASYGNFRKRRAPTPTSGRVWFVARRRGCD